MRHGRGWGLETVAEAAISGQSRAGRRSGGFMRINAGDVNHGGAARNGVGAGLHGKDRGQGAATGSTPAEDYNSELGLGDFRRRQLQLGGSRAWAVSGICREL